MACFQLILGEPRGEAVVRNKDRLAHPHDVVGAQAEDVEAIDIQLDPYVSYRVWSHHALDELIAVLARNLATWIGAVTDETLRSLHRRESEPWIDAMIATRVAEDPRIAIATKVLALARSAAADAGTLVYRGD